jgi:selenide,water dikinase
LPRKEDPDLLVGYETSDDAGIYRLTPEIAIVTTADFITPPVNDPFLYGQIAAANALSDVYAMGGRPVTCLNLIGFPADKLEAEILHQIVAGALAKITEAGAVLAGGHTVEDDEPKFGLAVTGVVHPERYWSNSGARPGDALILTKPLGCGVLLNANIKKLVSEAAMNACLQTMTLLNRMAAEVLLAHDVHAVTDVTGFGLAGHSLEMAQGSDVEIELALSKIPVMDEALTMYDKGVTTGVNQANHDQVAPHLEMAVQASQGQQQIIFDPQTSGGLLAAVPEPAGSQVVTDLQAAGVPDAVIIGKVGERKGNLFLRVV